MINTIVFSLPLLPLPPPSSLLLVWDHTQSSTVQWDDARALWNAVRQTWRELAEEEGIIATPHETEG